MVILVLFNYVERHGEPLFDLINSSVKNGRKVFFVHIVDVKDREEIRAITEQESMQSSSQVMELSPLVLTSKTYTISFLRVHQNQSRNLQSIGRVLREENKNTAVLYDIADDTFKDSNNPNYTLRHLFEQVKIYNRKFWLWDNQRKIKAVSMEAFSQTSS